MTERLDRIEAACDRNTEAISALIGSVQTISQRVVQIIDVMQAMGDQRQDTRNALTQVIQDNQRRITDNENRFEAMLSENRADRMEWRRQIEMLREEQRSQLEIYREEQQRQLEIYREEQQRRDEEQQHQNEEWRRQMTAQNQAIQALLRKIANHDDRLDRLEAS